MLDPIVKTIEVPCDQQTAFRVFISEMGAWWPLDRFTVSAMEGAPAQAIRVDAKAGGEIVEIAADGTEHAWGTIRDYDPYGYVSMDFNIPPPGYRASPPPGYDPDGRTLVEVRFTDLAGDRTEVTLTQSNWEALGGMAGGARGGYDGGWSMIFEQAYKSACGG